MNDDELSPDEREALANLKRDVLPPAGVEAQTIAALRSRGLLRAGQVPLFRGIAAAAVLLCAFASGVAWDRSVARTPTVREPRFMLLLYGGDTVDRVDRRAEYAGWARSIAAGGVEITGEELSDTGEEIPAGAAVGSAPRGYFIVAASNADEAQRIAASCPHVRHGGRIVIRPIVSGS